MDRGWHSGKSALECHKYMLENQIACDTELIFPMEDGSSVKLHCHKYILMCRSPVFEAMLNGDYVETSKGVTIIDIEPDIFKVVLRYMYCDECDLTGDNVLHVLFAAKKYLLDGLSQRCRVYLDEQMCEDNVCSILNSTLLYTDEDLVEKCLQFISTNSSKTFQSDNFLSLNQESLKRILACDKICLETESKMFHACVKWAMHQQAEDHQNVDVSVSDILGKCVKEIRYSSMSVEEFAECVDAVPELLTVDIQAAIFRYIALAKRSECYPTGYTAAGRICKRACVSPCRFKSKTSLRWVEESSVPDKINFSVNRPIVFNGITMFGGNPGQKYSLQVTLQKAAADRTFECVTHDTTFTTTTLDVPVEIRLKNGHHLKPNQIYIITTSHKGPGRVTYGTQGLDTVVDGHVTFTFSDNRDSRHTTVKVGHVPQIIYSL